MGIGLNALLEIRDDSKIDYKNLSQYKLRPQMDFVTTKGEVAGFRGDTPSLIDIDVDHNYLRINGSKSDKFDDTIFNMPGLQRVDACPNSTFIQKGWATKETLTCNDTITLPAGHYIVNCNSCSTLEKLKFDEEFILPPLVNNLNSSIPGVGRG